MAHHPIVHVEFPAGNPTQGSQFYAGLFGWRIQVEETFDYVMFEAEGGPGGGFVTQGTDDSVDAVVPYVGTADLDATLAKAVSLGAEMVREKTEIPGMGCLALFRDPSGNVVGLWQDLQSAAT